MKITINIPKDFEEHFNSDRFKDSLLRLCCDANCLAGNYEKETAIMLINALEYAEVESDEQHKWADIEDVINILNENQKKLNESISASEEEVE